MNGNHECAAVCCRCYRVLHVCWWGGGAAANLCPFSAAGRVRTGMDVVKRMGMVETDSGDRPMDDVRISRADVVIA